MVPNQTRLGTMMGEAADQLGLDGASCLAKSGSSPSHLAFFAVVSKCAVVLKSS